MMVSDGWIVIILRGRSDTKDILGRTMRLPDDELARIGEQHEVPKSKRKWSGCGHWVYNEPPNDGCMPTPHFWDNVAWRDADGVDGTMVGLS
jgi:hypothetical protein